MWVDLSLLLFGVLLHMVGTLLTFYLGVRYLLPWGLDRVLRSPKFREAFMRGAEANRQQPKP